VPVTTTSQIQYLFTFNSGHDIIIEA